MSSITEGMPSELYAKRLVEKMGPEAAICYMIGRMQVMNESIDHLRYQIDQLTTTLVTIKSKAQQAASRGGQSTSEAKAKAARENGTKGGRPKHVAD